MILKENFLYYFGFLLIKSHYGNFFGTGKNNHAIGNNTVGNHIRRGHSVVNSESRCPLPKSSFISPSSYKISIYVFLYFQSSVTDGFGFF